MLVSMLFFFFLAHLLLISENIPSARKLENKSPPAHFHLCYYSRYYMPPSISLFMFLLAPAQRWARIRLLVCSLFHLKLKSFRIANKGRRTHTSNCTPWKTMRTIEWWKARKNIYRREQRNDKWWSGEEMLLAKKQHGYPVRLGSDRFSSQQQAKSTTTMPMPIMTEEEAQAKKIAHKH